MIKKNEEKEQAKKQRVFFPFNIGERTHKSKKEYNRQKEKLFCKKYSTE